MDDAFAENFVPLAPPVVLGRRLLPFCLWHKFGLDALKSPFAGYPGPLNLATLDTALRVCQARFPDILTSDRWPLTSCPGLRACWLQYRYGRSEWREVAAFMRYLSYAHARCPVFGRTAESAPYKAPWQQVLVQQLMRADAHLTATEAWMMPLGMALWRIAAATEAAGGKIEILTEEDRVAIRAAGGTV